MKLEIENTIENIRKDFPLLQTCIYGKPLIYFDNAATTQKPRCVIDKMDEMYYKYNGNIHRGVHYLSQQSTTAHEDVRELVARFIGAKHAHEIIFTQGTTASINLVASSYGELMQEGDEMIVSQMEHHSNIVPWQLMCQRKGVVLKVIPFNAEGELEMEEFKKMLSPRTRLVSVTHISNALGTVNPIQEIIALSHANKTLVFIDAAQSSPHIPLDVQVLDADFVAFSGHKMYGPTGIGVLYGKENHLERMPPYQGGGEMIAKVTFEKTTYNELPFKFEAGTPNYVGAVGLGAAIDYLNQLGMQSIKEYEDKLLGYACACLAKLPQFRFIGNALHRSGIISFLLGNIHPFDAGTLLDKLGIEIRTGHHCAQPVMDAYGIDGTMRVSFSFYNTKEEIDQLMEALQKVQKILS